MLSQALRNQQPVTQTEPLPWWSVESSVKQYIIAQLGTICHILIPRGLMKVYPWETGSSLEVR